MVQKRPLEDEQIFVSFKHQRQVGHNKELVSFSESVFAGDVSRKPQTLDDGLEKCNSGGEEKLSGDVIADLPKVWEDIKASKPDSCTISSRTTSSTRGEDSLAQATCHGSFFPEYFNPERPIRTLASEDIYSFLLDHPPRKSASIGPEHQAVVPPWGAHGTNNMSNNLDTFQAVVNSDLENEKRLMGTCVIPMPDSELLTDTDCIVGKGRTDCSCEDRASVRCVRHHILEAREKLIKTIGPERFVELGFGDMGEQVAETWSEEEEQLFHQVVFSNPASLDKDFWDNLSVVFPSPSRTKKEIVSYYFNVFMLRKRARQNRYDPFNIDSDNDEWEGSNVHGDNEPGVTEDDNEPGVTEDDDSVVESPGCQDDPGYNRSWGGDMREYDEDDTCGDNVNVDIYGGSIQHISDNNGSSSPKAQFQDKIAWDEKGDQEVQDDSCTSFETGAASQDNQLRSENGDHWEVGCFDGTSKLGDHEYVLEPCDAKVWDSGYLTCRKNKVDFLPTCNMIEEVFGKDSWNNYKARDGKNLS